MHDVKPSHSCRKIFGTVCCTLCGERDTVSWSFTALQYQNYKSCTVNDTLMHGFVLFYQWYFSSILSQEAKLSDQVQQVDNSRTVEKLYGFI